LARIQEVRPIAVHVRRGDLVSKASYLLGAAYYQRALDRFLSSQQHAPPLLFFSDSSRESQALVDEVAWPARKVLVAPERDARAAEHLELMASCTSVIAANSTFSWAAIHMRERVGPSFGPGKFPRSFFHLCPHVETVRAV